jgi:hypothetical protein
VGGARTEREYYSFLNYLYTNPAALDRDDWYIVPQSFHFTYFRGYNPNPVYDIFGPGDRDGETASPSFAPQMMGD